MIEWMETNNIKPMLYFYQHLFIHFPFTFDVDKFLSLVHR